jgi:3-oxoacyl-[acyl-carrier protein] reductase
MRLASKVACVTGAGSGIGRAIALRFAEEGAVVAVVDLRPTAAQETVSLVTAKAGRAEAITADVANSAQVRRAMTAIVDQFGTLDVLVNNAGIAEVTDHVRERSAQVLLERLAEGRVVSSVEATRTMTDEAWRRTIAVHLDGTFHCTREALHVMEARRAGVIINMASVAGLTGLASAPHYAAAKAGIIGLTRSVAREVGPLGIRVNAIAPGYIETPMTAQIPDAARRVITAQTALGRIGQPEEIAALAVFLASDDASFITGEVISPNGGLLI